MSAITTPSQPAEQRCAPAVPEPSAGRQIPVRRIDFGFGEVVLPRHFMNDDLVLSHFVTVLSCAFPEGEDFFVKSVRNYRDRIEDPELRAQVAGFIGQESIHGREHRALNESLGQLGYPVKLLDGRVRIMLKVFSALAPKAYQLALTAALEHYTATLAEILLTTDMLESDTDVEEIRELFRWHAMEESEHKSVAFDVFQQVSGSERIRIGVMRFATYAFVMAVITGMTLSLALDPAARDLSRLRRSLSRFRRNPLLSKRMWTQIRAYNSVGFHPEDSDTTQMLAAWSDRLFGEDGELSDKLKVPASATRGAGSTA